MKTINSFLILILFILSFCAIILYAQYRKSFAKEDKQSKKVEVFCKRHCACYRSIIFHPNWAPNLSFESRWIYFPRFNFYWDNYREIYLYNKKGVWVNSSILPDEIRNVDFNKEMIIELSRENDSVESIQTKNAEHYLKFINETKEQAQ